MADLLIIESIEYEREIIAYLQTWPDAQLQERLRIIHAQRALAGREKNERALELLEVWEQQVMKASYSNLSKPQRVLTELLFLSSLRVS